MMAAVVNFAIERSCHSAVPLLPFWDELSCTEARSTASANGLGACRWRLPAHGRSETGCCCEKPEPLSRFRASPARADGLQSSYRCSASAEDRGRPTGKRLDLRVHLRFAGQSWDCPAVRIVQQAILFRGILPFIAVVKLRPVSHRGWIFQVRWSWRSMKPGRMIHGTLTGESAAPTRCGEPRRSERRAPRLASPRRAPPIDRSRSVATPPQESDEFICISITCRDAASIRRAIRS